MVLRPLNRFVTRNVAEIAADPALRGYGVALALVHLITRIHWGLREGMNVPWLLSGHDVPVCWPFFSDCAEWRRLGEGTWRGLFSAYAVLAVVDAVLFLRGRVRPALGLLLLLNVSKWLVLAQDFRLGANYHYVAFISTFAFLFLPGKRDVGRLLIVAYYLSAARLKLNYDWLSGESLPRHVFLTGTLLRVATTYVVVLESVVSLGLLARRRLWFWGAFAQLCVFHAYSVTAVGAPFPLFMGCLLTIFLLSRYAEAGEPAREGVLVRFLSGQSPRVHYGALAAYAAAQLVPLVHPGDAALTGRGRAFALTLVDAKTSCDVLAVARRSPSDREEIVLQRVQVLPRIQCDPVVFASFARDRCGELRVTSPAAELDVYAVGRRAGDARLAPLMVAEEACSRPPNLSLLGRTDWIRP